MILFVVGVSYPGSERSETKLRYMCPRCSNHTYGQQLGKTNDNVMITSLSEYIPYKMTPRYEKDYIAGSITMLILRAA
jgi:hypothetical protein